MEVTEKDTEETARNQIQSLRIFVNQYAGIRKFSLIITDEPIKDIK